MKGPRFSLVVAILTAFSAEARAPWIVSIDLGVPNLEYGIVQNLDDSAVGCTRAVTLGGETGRASNWVNSLGQQAEGIFLDLDSSFADEARGKSVWLLIEVFSTHPNEVRLNYRRAGDTPLDPLVVAASATATLPRGVRAAENQWGYILHRCENVRLQDGLRGRSDLQLVLPEDGAVVNRIFATRFIPEFSTPDTGGLGIRLRSEGVGTGEGPALSPLRSPGVLTSARGIVRDSGSIGGVGGALVELVNPNDNTISYQAFTDSTGTYQIPLANKGVFRLRVSLGGLDPETFPNPIKIREDVEQNDLGEVRVPVDGRLFTSRFRSQLDGTEQAYALYLPKEASSDSKRKFPLVVALHDSGDDPLTSLRSMVTANRAAAPDSCILLGPGGRGDSNYEGIGEADVLEAIAFAQKNYPVNPERIHLTGYGMGGIGSLRLGARYPDRFASISALAAQMDLIALEPEDLPSFQRRCLRIHSPQYHVDNLRGFPVRVFQPKSDPNLSEQGKKFRERFDEGVDSLLYRESRVEGRDLMREVYGSADFFRTVSQDKRQSSPNRVTFEAGSMTPAGAYWMTPVHQERADRPYHVDARILDGNTVWIESANLSTMKLNLSHPNLLPGLETKVWWNGKLEWRGIPQEGTPVILQSNKPGGRWLKEPYLSGPAEAVFLKPCVCVVGEGIQMTPQETAYRECLKSRGWASHEGPFLSAQELSSYLLKTNNLILLGLPSENSVVQSLQGDLPFSVKGDKVSIGRFSYQGDDVGFATVFPNPLEDNHLILWIAGVGLKGIRNLGKTTFRWPDYLVVNDEIGAGGPTEVLCAGFYDRAWRVDPRDLYQPSKQR